MDKIRFLVYIIVIRRHSNLEGEPVKCDISLSTWCATWWANKEAGPSIGMEKWTM
jgi:hypothetical protein